MREDWLAALVGTASATVLSGGLLAASALPGPSLAAAAEPVSPVAAPAATSTDAAASRTCDVSDPAVLTLTGVRDDDAFRLTGTLRRGGCPLEGRVLDLLVDGGGPVATVLTDAAGDYRVSFEPAPGTTATYTFTARAGAATSVPLTLR